MKTDEMNIDFEYKEAYIIVVTISIGGSEYRYEVSPKNNGWKSVEEELPDDRVMVLCVDKYGKYFTAWYTARGKEWNDCEEEERNDIKYWMKIPPVAISNVSQD